jgi:diamine N-acetyltransferase
MSITIIRADVSYAATIATIGKKSFRNAFEHLFRSKVELFEYLEHTYEPVKLAKSMRKGNNVYFLAMFDKQPAGFAKVKMSSLNEHIESIAQMELQKIFVLPEYRDYGIGTALLNEVKSLADEIYPDYIWLNTHISNNKALRFYEKNGFEVINKDFFTVGSQVFEYHVMGFAVPMNIKTAC